MSSSFVDQVPTLCVWQYAQGQSLLGQRHTARPIRTALIGAIDAHPKVVLDFRKVDATQGFIDELLGPLILSRGPQVLDAINFSGCSESVRATIRFVVRDRAAQYQQRAQGERSGRRSTETEVPK